MKPCIPKKLSLRVVTGSVLIGALIGTSAFLVDIAVHSDRMKEPSATVGGFEEFESQMAAADAAAVPADDVK